MKKVISVLFVCLFATSAFAAVPASTPATGASSDAPKAVSAHVKKKHSVKRTHHKKAASEAGSAAPAAK